MAAAPEGPSAEGSRSVKSGGGLGGARSVGKRAVGAVRDVFWGAGNPGGGFGVVVLVVDVLDVLGGR